MMLGAWELVVVAIAALLVLGPEKLPELARTLARLTAQAQNMIGEVRRQVDAALHPEDAPPARPPPPPAGAAASPQASSPADAASTEPAPGSSPDAAAPPVRTPAPGSSAPRSDDEP